MEAIKTDEAILRAVALKALMGVVENPEELIESITKEGSEESFEKILFNLIKGIGTDLGRSVDDTAVQATMEKILSGLEEFSGRSEENRETICLAAIVVILTDPKFVMTILVANEISVKENA